MRLSREALRICDVLRELRPASAATALAAVVLAAPTASSDGPRDVGSVFFVAKSENRNQVHYGIHVDASCAPVGAAPVFAYWRMIEHGPLATEPLLSREIPAYGLAEQRILDRGDAAGRVTVRLRALEDRAIEITTASRGGVCEAEPPPSSTEPLPRCPTCTRSCAGPSAWITCSCRAARSRMGASCGSVCHAEADEDRSPGERLAIYRSAWDVA